MKLECRYCKHFLTEKCNRNRFADDPACLKFKSITLPVKNYPLVVDKNGKLKRFYGYEHKKDEDFYKIMETYIKQAFAYANVAKQYRRWQECESEMYKMFYRAAVAMRQADAVRWWMYVLKDDGK